jgi:hypothetical protein
MNAHYLLILMDDDGIECERKDVTPEIRRLQGEVLMLKELLAYTRQVAAELDRRLLEGRQ